MNSHPYQWVRWGSLQAYLPTLERALLVVDPRVWEAHGARFSLAPTCRLVQATSLDASALEAMLPLVEDAESIVGLGGGTAIDCAKYLAWRSGRTLTLIPSALTVDAPFTDSCAVRHNGKLHYTGHITPESVLIDIPFIQSAPPHLNRGGVGDILSIHTALYDWQLAHAHTGEPYDAEIADRSRALLHRLEQEAHEVAQVSERGVRLLVELFCEEVALCMQMGNSRPEEGSEHHVLYTLEYQTERTYLHGRAVTLCALLVAYLQGNAPESLRTLADACQVDYLTPIAEAGALAIERALLSASDYARTEQLPDTFLTLQPPTPQQVREAIEWLIG